MKTKLLLFVFSLFAILAPVKPMVLMAVATIILDMGFGIWRSVKKNGYASFRSRKLSHTISKTFLYSLAIVFVFFVEKYIASDLVAHFIAIDLILTKAVALFCVFTEVVSINESYESVTGRNILKSLKSFVLRAKEEADKIKE